MKKSELHKYVRALCEYFATVELPTESGKTLVIKSDGRAGDGVSHWRTVSLDGKLVADLTGHTGDLEASVTIAKNEDLRDSTEIHNFSGMVPAVEFLRKRF